MFGQKTKDSEPSTFTMKPEKSSQIKTLLSEGCKFDGNLYSPEYTKIDGVVTGNLSGESGLVIGQKGIINGDISSVEVVIEGNVKGNIRAHKCEIKKGGILVGDVFVDYIVIDYGAVFNGTCKINENIQQENSAFEVPNN
jgi:cytoskeletal protein CcmA (bactofilin family)